MEYLRSLMDANFMSHGHCFRWTSDILWLHVLGDIVTAMAYYLIPAALAYFVIKKNHLPYPSLFILFGLFILACGTTHILSVVTIWHPVYRLEGWVKSITALISIGTAVMLYPVIPKALKLRSPEELENLNRELEQKNHELVASRESFQNIDALRQSQLHLLQQSQKMEAVGRLTGGIAHDFNNVLTVISGFSTMALSKLPEGSPIRENILEVIRAQEQASQLTRQLLAFSRKQAPTLRALDLNQVVRGISNMIRRIIGEDIALSLRLEAEPPRIKMDTSQLEQVILNLAVNARDAMPKGGELLVETRNVHLTPGKIHGGDRVVSGEYILLAVSDKGTGMPQEVKERLFEPYFTTKDTGKGTGLGLSIVHGIVMQAGGLILVDSEPGKGSTFRLYFPMTVSEQDDDALEAPESTMPAASASETILVVEDEASIRELVGEVLQNAGYTVIQADDGESALVKAEACKEHIHLLLTDVIMKRMSGSVLTAEIQKLRPGIRVLFMSGYTDDAVLQQGIQDGDYPFLQKPFSPIHLLDHVRQVLDAPEPDLYTGTFRSKDSQIN